MANPPSKNASSELAHGWEMVVGLEVHTELSTKTKLFCGCPNSFGDSANTNVCPTCLGLPGSLPSLNEEAVKLAVKIGLALNCEVKDSVFHRKNYFYPDMPKDFQISQYDQPINEGGFLQLPFSKTIGIVRAHIEEDTGKITHVGDGGRINSASSAQIDYNRAGVPLVEIVSAPEISTPAEAREYVTELRAILIAVGASDGRMEEGSLRVDANVSVRRTGEVELRTRCEIKNLNSLRSLTRAITYEAHRQVNAYEAGEQVLQQTRHWDEGRSVTTALRVKEEAHDYRYFREPDLLPLEPDEAWISSIALTLGELPGERRRKLIDALGLSHSTDQVEKAISQELYPFISAALEAGVDPKMSLARTANELAALAPLPVGFTPQLFIEAMMLEASGQLPPTQAKVVLAEMVRTSLSASRVVSDLNISMLTSDDLEMMVSKLVEESPAEWARFCAGEEQLGGFFIGKVMRDSKGKADGKAVTSILRRLREST